MTVAVSRLVIMGLAAAAVLGGLLLTRPQLAGDPSAWSGDELARITCWFTALAVSAWLAVMCAAGAAVVLRHDPCSADRLLAFAPPFVRRMVEAAVVVSCLAGAAPAAHAATGPSPQGLTPSTVVVHVSPGGEFRGASVDEPVVRRPASAPTTSTTPPASTTSTTRITTATSDIPTPSPSRSAPVAPTPTPAVAAPNMTPAATAPVVAEPGPTAATPRTHVVQAGDNLWTIARSELRATRPQAGEVEIARYWRRVIAANRSNLRSGDPSLIFPGEVVSLPSVASLP
jgi:hypothetical protein